MKAWKPAMAAHDPEALKAVYRDPSWRSAVRQELPSCGLRQQAHAELRGTSQKQRRSAMAAS